MYVCMYVCTYACMYVWMHVSLSIYHMTKNFGGEFFLADWRFWEQSANISSAKICTIIFLLNKPDCARPIDLSSAWSSQLTAARGHYAFKEFRTPEVEEEREGAEDNPNGVVYAVAVKTDVEIIVSNLLRQILAACSLFLRWSGMIVCKVRLQASVSRSAKKKLVSLCTLQHSWEKLRIGMKIIQLWSNNSAYSSDRDSSAICSILPD